MQLKDGAVYPVTLPGTLDENGIGGPDEAQVATRLTRLHVYNGPAVFIRRLTLACEPGNRLFLSAERMRAASLLVDGMPVPARSGSLSTPWTFELTGYADGAMHEVRLISDNTYPGMPSKEIIYSSAATDETQTNWNGILGEISLVEQPKVFVDSIRLICTEEDVCFRIGIDASEPYQGKLTIRSKALVGDSECEIDVPGGLSDMVVPVTISAEALRWDEYSGQTYQAAAELTDFGCWTSVCGVRCFGSNDLGRLTINRRVFFLRGEANCCVFPEAGHVPMSKADWLAVLKTYMAYGVNCMRFHSHCPPDAAFAAADEIGMLMQPELSQWDPAHAFESQASYDAYRHELLEIIRNYGHHPSFVMLSLGNELQANEIGVARMYELLHAAQMLDKSRIYTWGSNNFYGAKQPDNRCGYYTSANCGEHMLRCTSANMEGKLNQQMPNTSYTFDEGIDQLRKNYQGPVYGFEVGQYEVLPDFDEIDDFKGVTRAVNYDLVREQVRAKGLLQDWKQQVEATGEISLMCYREEVEAVLRTERMSGLSLLGLQDFPGQGTALVGMLNAHLQPKPFAFAQPERFHGFFRAVLPMAMLQKRTYSRYETLVMQLALANYGRSDLNGAIQWSLSDGKQTVSGETRQSAWPQGELTRSETISIPLANWHQAAKLTLAIQISEHINQYDLWVYPDEYKQQKGNVLVTADVQEALAALRGGGCVFLAPPADEAHIPGSVQCSFSTDFWSVGTFPTQAGTMGCLIQTEHPIFRAFPTEHYSTWQWWQMTRGRAIKVPQRIRPVVKVMDCYKYLRSLALLCECQVGEGRLMLCGMGLLELQEHVEARALLNAVLDYMAAESFQPTDRISEAELLEIFTKQ